MEVKKILESDLENKGVLHMQDTPNLSPYELQYKVEEIVRDVVIPAFNNNAEIAVTKKDMYDYVEIIGGGDMQKAIYDINNNGMVDKAEYAISSGTSTNALQLNGKSDTAFATAQQGAKADLASRINLIWNNASYTTPISVGSITNIDIQYGDVVIILAINSVTEAYVTNAIVLNVGSGGVIQLTANDGYSYRRTFEVFPNIINIFQAYYHPSYGRGELIASNNHIIPYQIFRIRGL